FSGFYTQAYNQALLQKLGFRSLSPDLTEDLVGATLELLLITRMNYHQFFDRLRQKCSRPWRDDSAQIEQALAGLILGDHQSALRHWCELYQWILSRQSVEEMAQVRHHLQVYNPPVGVANADFEAIWEAIAQDNNWQPFREFLKKLHPPIPNPDQPGEL
ncbi:MAG: protein adenylyltransferase SelO family protein, partial [Leptolyngbyaceae cyanobacterium]